MLKIDENRDNNRDKIKEETMDSAMDNNLCAKPSMSVQYKQEVVIKIEKDDLEYVDSDSQCPMLVQSGQEGSLLIDKEEKVVFQRSDGFKIYFIKQEPEEEVFHQDTGTCSRVDMASEQSSLQQLTWEAQPMEETEVVDTKQDSVEDEGVQAASQVSSGGCRNVLEESRPRNSEPGRSKHAKLPSNVGIGNIRAEEITESDEGSEANVALSSQSDIAIVQVEVPVPRTYTCPMCSKRFSKRYHLKEHKYRIHSGESPFECPQCQEGFGRLRDLEYHFKIRHRSIYKTACECGDILTDKQLDGHKRTCMGQKWDQCVQCEKHIPGGLDLKQLKTVHNAERLYCSGYVKILPLNAALSKCERKQPNVNPHKCLKSTRQKLCNSENGIKNTRVCIKNEQGLSSTVPLGGIDREELNENRQKSLNDERLSNSENGIKNTTVCIKNEQELSSTVPLGGIDREELNENRQKSVNDERLSNSENGASCTEDAKLNSDAPESNLAAKELEAEQGNESSIILPSGSNTIRLEKGILKARPHSCSECSKRFLTKGHLKEHMWTHTGAKPLACSECNKGFFRRRGLLNHLSRHHADIYNQLCEWGEDAKLNNDVPESNLAAKELEAEQGNDYYYSTFRV